MKIKSKFGSKIKEQSWKKPLEAKVTSPKCWLLKDCTIMQRFLLMKMSIPEPFNVVTPNFHVGYATKMLSLSVCKPQWSQILYVVLSKHFPKYAGNCSHRNKNINVANSFENTKWQHSYVTLFWYEWCKKILLQCVLNMDYFIHFYVMFCFTKICILAIKFFFKKLIVNLNLSKSKRCLRKVEGVNIVVLRISWILLKL